MSYVDKNLMSNERVVYKASIHWVVYLRGVVLLVIAGALFTPLVQLPLVQLGPAGERESARLGIAALGALLVLLAIVSLIRALVSRRSTELAVTSRRIIAKFGLVRRRTIELNHPKVESFNVDQSILGRILGYGTLVINGTGGGHTPIPSIDNPLEFRRRAMETIDVRQG